VCFDSCWRHVERLRPWLSTVIVRVKVHGVMEESGEFVDKKQGQSAKKLNFSFQVEVALSSLNLVGDAYRISSCKLLRRPLSQ